MKRLPFSLCLLIGLWSPTVSAIGQPKDVSQIKAMYVLSDTSLPNYPKMDQSKHEALDTTLLSVEYSHLFARDVSAEKPDSTGMRLEVGRRYTAFYSIVTFKDDSLRTVCNKMNLRNPPEGESFSWDARPTYTIFRDLQKGELTIQERIPFESGYVVEHAEPAAELSWQIEDGSQEICGYNCQRATTRYGGRTWVVWFAPEIPISVGPWKLNGLPGAILLAEDSGRQFVFHATSIYQCKKAILKYIWPTKRMSKSQWSAFERKLHESPMQIVNQSGGTFIMDKKTGKWLDDQWTWPYNPLELE